MKTLFILNDAPYGSERSYNGARLAGALAKQDEQELRIFLMGDAVAAAHRQQKVPSGFYNMEVMLGTVARHGGQIAACGSCMDARGIDQAELMDGSRRGSLDELTQWTLWADKVLVF